VPFALLVVTLIAGGLGLLLLLNTVSAANEVRRHGLAEQDASVAAQLQQLHNEVAASAAPDNLARAAADLGMVPAGHPAFLVLGPDGTVKVMGSPKAVSGAALENIPAKQAKSSPPAGHTPSHTPSNTAKNTATNTAKNTAKNTAGRTGTATSSSTAPASPTTTPTPTVVLPGGNR
jgi:hypothetical protein